MIWKIHTSVVNLGIKVSIDGLSYVILYMLYFCLMLYFAILLLWEKYVEKGSFLKRKTYKKVILFILYMLYFCLMLSFAIWLLWEKYVEKGSFLKGKNY